MSNAYIRMGETRSGFSMVYHELFDLYHPYIGDKATMYYLYLLRFRNNEQGGKQEGKSWKGRNSVTEKFQLSYSTLPLLDEILEASGLVNIERKPVGRGKDKIYYIVNDPLDRERFREKEDEIRRKLTELISEYEGRDKPIRIASLFGKEEGAKLTQGNIKSPPV
jgi:replication initiation and membrane attachment protein DnaB